MCIGVSDNDTQWTNLRSCNILMFRNTIGQQIGINFFHINCKINTNSIQPFRSSPPPSSNYSELCKQNDLNTAKFYQNHKILFGLELEFGLRVWAGAVRRESGAAGRFGYYPTMQ